eukprot:1146530-Pelagomonas_calceolata.AAC.10
MQHALQAGVGQAKAEVTQLSCSACQALPAFFGGTQARAASTQLTHIRFSLSSAFLSSTQARASFEQQAYKP